MSPTTDYLGLALIPDADKLDKAALSPLVDELLEIGHRYGFEVWARTRHPGDTLSGVKFTREEARGAR
jgi:hypothetical protein